MIKIKKEYLKDYNKIVVTQDDVDRLMDDDDFKLSAPPIKIRIKNDRGWTMTEQLDNKLIKGEK